eukprot:m.51100 g.51100  ORF g.51100 m.51100 type:complete len:262 (+) comp34112_c0_seq23:813-1598(+)
MKCINILGTKVTEQDERMINSSCNLVVKQGGKVPSSTVRALENDPLYEPGEEHAEAAKYEEEYDAKAQRKTSKTTQNEGSHGDEPFVMENVVKKLLGMFSELKDETGENSEERKTKGSVSWSTDKEGQSNDGDDDSDDGLNSHTWKVRVRKVKTAAEGGKRDGSNLDKKAKKEDKGDEGEEGDEKVENSSEEFAEALNKAKEQIESMFKKGLEEAGIKTEGAVQVKFITADDEQPAKGMRSLTDKEMEEINKLLVSCLFWI